MTYIVVEGPIGVGKTVLTRLLGERLGMPTVFEQFEENPFLSNFYADRARYAFQTEVFFLLNRYRQQESVVKPAAGKGNLASDYLFAKTKLFAGMNLSGDEFKLFEQLYEALSKQVPGPDQVGVHEFHAWAFLAVVVEHLDPSRLQLLIEAGGDALHPPRPVGQRHQVRVVRRDRDGPGEAALVVMLLRDAREQATHADAV